MANDYSLPVGDFGTRNPSPGTPDVSKPPPIPPGFPAPAIAYNNFLDLLRSGVLSNAQAYLNKRVASKLFGDGKVTKILTGATFIPADSSGFQMGSLQVENIQYFVVHRPGYAPGGSTASAIIQEFSSRGKAAATHFIIDLAGGLYQMVDLGDIAYHCGNSYPANNSNSVGAELEGAIGSPVSSDQYATLAKLLSKLNSITKGGFLPLPTAADFVEKFKERVVAHSAIRVDKADPGPTFSFEVLASFYSRTSTETDIWRPPLSPVDEVSALASSVFAAAGTATTASGTIATNSMIQQAMGISRLYQLLGQDRAGVASWATDAAQRQASFLADRIAQQVSALTQASTIAIPINVNNYNSFYDYTESLFQKEKG